MNIEANHWREVTGWRWSHFTPQEMACRGSQKINVSPILMDKLEALRNTVGPMTILSGYRSPEHNREVGGAAQSKHVMGQAADVSMVNHDPAEFYDAARQVGFLGIGFYPGQNFMHVDLGPKRWWGDPARWGIDPKAAAKAVARKSAKGLVGAAFIAEPVQQAAYQLQIISDVSDYIRIAAGLLGVVAAGLMIWAAFSTKEKEQS